MSGRAAATGTPRCLLLDPAALLLGAAALLLAPLPCCLTLLRGAAAGCSTLLGVGALHCLAASRLRRLWSAAPDSWARLPLVLSPKAPCPASCSPPRRRSVFTCKLQSKVVDEWGTSHIRQSRLHLVDLAGGRLGSRREGTACAGCCP